MLDDLFLLQCYYSISYLPISRQVIDMKPILKMMLILLLSLISFEAWAVMVVSEAAQNVMAPANYVSAFIEKLSALIGIGFVLGSFIQYRQHRVSPTATPLSRCIVMLLLGLALIGISIIGYYARSTI